MIVAGDVRLSVQFSFSFERNMRSGVSRLEGIGFGSLLAVLQVDIRA
jgi:hypothetical protein